MSNNETLPVRIKGVGDGLWVTVDPDLPADTLKKELEKPFERLRHLAVNARIIIDNGRDQPDGELIDELGEFLRENFQVGLVSAPPEEKPEARAQAPNTSDLAGFWNQNDSEAMIIAGRVRSGQKIRARNHLVIMGDLNPGAEAIAGGDIIVLGSLMGTAIAGQPENEEAIVMALDFRPTQVQIGGLVAAGTPVTAGTSPEFARVEGNAIVVIDYLKDNPFKRLARPEVR